MVRSSRSTRLGAAGAALAAALIAALGATQAAAQGLDFSLATTADAGSGASPAFAPGQVIVRFAPSSDTADRAQARAAAGTASPESLGLPGLQLVDIRDGESVAATIAELEADPAVRYAEPNLTFAIAQMPDDPLAGDLWGLENMGQGVGGFSGPAVDADIDAERAWDVEQGDSDTVLAVMDTGIDVAHPDLQPQLWQNPGEAGGTPGVDDDGNGKVDDVVGWDFLNSASNDSTPNQEDSDPSDLHGHGTHVAGTAMARGANALGVTGVAQAGSIMPLRVCAGYDGSCPIADQIEAINYAAAEGARVLNGSIAGDGVSQAVRDTLNAHPGTLFVFAAGNDGDDIEAAPQGPCQADQVGSGAYTANNVICVGATDQADRLAAFSNRAATGIDLAAPGTQIVSTSARRVMFSDDFETDDFATRWTPSPGSSWSRTSEAPLDSPGISDSPGADYLPGTVSELTSEEIDLPAGYSSCRLNYVRSTFLGAGDSFDIEVLLNGAAAEDISFGGPRADTPRRTYISLNPSFDAGGDVRIRLRVTADATGEADGVHMDDISLVCSGPPSDGAYETRQGTSMAAPHVSGAAALIFSRDPDATPAQVKQLLLGSVDAIPALAGTSATGGRLNAGTALAATPADTTITGGTVAEGGMSSSRTPSFTWVSTEPQPSFSCAIDDGPFGPCGATTPTLANGEHTFKVRTADPRGNVETTPAVRTFTVDSPAFGMQVDAGPGEGAHIADRTPTFAFSSPDGPGVTYHCKVDSGAQYGPAPLVPCSDGAAHTPAPLADGTWTLWVEARDASDALLGEASRTFHVDATSPQTTIQSGPPALGRATSAGFSFAAFEPGVTFECRLYLGTPGAWQLCTSPQSFEGLADGRYRFDVRAVDALGNADGTPATAGFEVDTQGPEVSVSASLSLTGDPTPDFGFEAEPGAATECSIDRGVPAYASCPAGQRHSAAAALADGTWFFRVRATDAAGNASEATHSFRVDTTAPQTRVARRPRRAIKTRFAVRRVTFVFAASEAARFLCAVDRKPLMSCPRRVERRMRPGRHRIRVVAVDAAGNRDATPAVYRFRIQRIR